MRLRYKLVTYHFGEDQSSQQSLTRHYRELMDELLRQSPHHSITQRTAQWRPATDIHETTDAILVKMELAGMREEDIEVTLYEDALVVTGRREDDVAGGAEVYYHEAQIRYGPFRAEVLLPGPVQRDGVEASYENGFLRVTLPKAVNPQPNEMRVNITPGKRTTSASQPLQAEGGVLTSPTPLPIAIGREEAEDGMMPLNPHSSKEARGDVTRGVRGGLRDA